MDQNTERRAARLARRGKRKFIPSLVQALVALGLGVVALAWAAERPLTLVQPGMRIELPGPVVRAPATPYFAYLAEAVGEDDARRLEPLAFRVASVLKRYTKDEAVADRAAAAVVAEGEKHNLDASLLVGLMIIENARIEPEARSNVGATGLMQVMPFHSGKWGCDSGNLVNIESNICHGVNILASYVKSSPNLDRALLRYNGCVRGTNTPNCHTYPTKVRTWAQHARAMMSAVEHGEDIRSVSLFPRSQPKAAAKRAPARPAASKARRG